MDSARIRGKPSSASLASKIKDLVEDYRTEVALKKQAILCYPAIAVPSRSTVSTITGWVSSPPIGLDSELAQAPSTLAKQCRQSVVYVIACVESLATLRNALVQFHGQIIKREPSDEMEFQATALRSGIDEVTQIIVAFEEFIGAKTLPPRLIKETESTLPLVSTACASGE